ncbi:MAG: HD domain-containing protein [Anaerolineales bacterium]|nr:HD domain-containing protein [Anaerolineales bacterium]
MDDQDSASLKLETRLAQAASELYHLAYIRVDSNLSILQVSPNISSVLVEADRVVAGVPLTDALGEFVGAEKALQSVLYNETPSFKIERVNQVRLDGSLHYLTFHVLPFNPNQVNSGLLVIFEDVTRFGLTEQSLLQKRNELSLLQGALAYANAELDKRVEQRTAELIAAKKQIEQQLFRLQALRENDIAILGTTDLRVGLRTIAEQAKIQLSVDLISILLFNAPLLALETAVVIGAQTVDLHNARIHLGESLIGRAALERRILAFPDLTTTIAIPQNDKWAQVEQLQACYAVPLIAKGNIVGVLFLGNRYGLRPDQEWLDFLETVAGQAAMAIESIKAFEDLQRSNFELALAYNRTIEGWSHALDLRDRETKDHTTRVTETTIKLAQRAGMTDTQIMHVKHGALLHDIGKMGIPDAILLKDDYLTEEEWKIMRKHPLYAYEMLFPIDYLRPALDIPYCHHERWDGTGYPRGLKGDEIPLAARLFAVADVWDALSSDRPYREGWPAEKVREYVISQSGSHFDPQAVDLFMRVMSEGKGDMPA